MRESTSILEPPADILSDNRAAAELPWNSVSSDDPEPEIPLQDPAIEPSAASIESPPIAGPSDLDSEIAELQPSPERRRASSGKGGAGGGGVTIPLMCLGMGLITMCLLIPASDDVHKLAYERARLQADLTQLQKQVETNGAFLKRVGDDPMLAERLARRQLRMVPAGSAVLNLKSIEPQGGAPDSLSSGPGVSPFLLVTLPPPAPMPPYHPIGGVLASICRNPQTQLYLIGASLMMIGAGLVLSRSAANAER